MGVTFDIFDSESRLRTWRYNCTLPISRTAKAMRVMLGLSPAWAAVLASIPFDLLAAFENGTIDGQYWRTVAHRLDTAYRARGARWCDPDLHDGACCVYLETGFADDRQAILAALALMGHTAGRRPRKVTVHLLAQRVEARSKIPAADLRKSLQGRGKFPAKLAAACFRQLGEGRDGAGCYFTAAPLTGWQQVGCDHRGSWW